MLPTGVATLAFVLLGTEVTVFGVEIVRGEFMRSMATSLLQLHNCRIFLPSLRENQSYFDQKRDCFRGRRKSPKKKNVDKEFIKGLSTKNL